MMNKLVILLLSACCLLMTACDKENDETAQGFRVMKAEAEQWKWLCRLPEN